MTLLKMTCGGLYREHYQMYQIIYNMKRVITLSFALILSVACFAQPGFSNAFPAEPTSHSNTCSNIRTSFAIIYDQDDYWCVVHMYGKYDYYTVSNKAYPRLYMKTNKGDTVELRSLESGDKAVLKNYIDKQYIINKMYNF